MKLYFAGGENKSWEKAIVEGKARRGLYSYYYLLARDYAPFPLQMEVFLDSGGFTAFTKGSVIDIGEYCAFVRANEERLAAYAVLDVIGDWEKTGANQVIMESEGLHPLPVFHFRSPIKVLEGMCEKYQYICLGGLVPHSKNKPLLRSWLAKCFSVTRDRTRVHGFGVTAFDLMKEFPFYSVDSTSYLVGSKRAEFYRFDKGKLIGVSAHDRASVIAEGNGDLRFTDQKDKRWMARVIANVVAFKEAEEYITELWRQRGVVWN